LLDFHGSCATIFGALFLYPFLMETPETPAQDEHKPGQKISAKKLWHSLKHSAKK
jgi:hypothetical protein